jgi:hypothetical protein
MAKKAPKPTRRGKGTRFQSKGNRPRTRTEKRSASTTWRRPRNMPLNEWEAINEKKDREMIEWARGLVIVDDEGNERKLTEEEVTEIARPGRWAGAARAQRRKRSD